LNKLANHIKTFFDRFSGAPGWVYLYLSFLLFISAFSPFIANNKPIVCREAGHLRCPVIKGVYSPIQTDIQWKTKTYEWAIWPPIRFSSQDIDLSHHPPDSPFPLMRDPFGAPHYLGTDELGRDVAAGIIHGAFLSVSIGILSMLIALAIGTLIGVISGYYGNYHLKASPEGLAILLSTTLLSWYWIATYDTTSSVSNRITLYGIIFLLWIIAFFGMKWLTTSYRTKRFVYVDKLGTLFIQLFTSIPGAFILLTYLVLTGRPSMLKVILIIGIMSWPRFANLARAQTLRIRSGHYILAAKLKGLSDWSIIKEHVLPFLWPTITTHLIFGIGSAILIEASISFLGLGLSGEQVTWGGLLASARRHIEAWWLMAFAGIMLFLTIYALHLLARAARSK